MTMKISMYNHYYLDKNNSYYIYNSLTNALVMCNVDEYNLLKNINNVDISEKFKKELIDNGLIYNSNNKEIARVIFDMYKERMRTNAMGLTIAPTLRCNFTCPYCYENQVDDKNDMDKSIQNSIIKYIKDKANSLSTLGITWYGGEPLLRFDIIDSISKEIISICKEYHINYTSSITTNGYLLTEDMYLQLIKLNIDQIQIPLDGDKYFHDKTRKTKSNDTSYDVIINNLKNISKYFGNEDKVEYNPKVILRINITRNNKSSIENLIYSLKDNNILDFAQYYFAKIDDYEDTSFQNVLTEKEFINLSNKHLSKLNIVDEDKINMLYPSLIKSFCVNDRINDFVISPNGTLYKCWEDIGLEHSIGNINNIEEITNNRTSLSEFELEYIKSPLTNVKCADCSLLPICMGGNCNKAKKIGINLDCNLLKSKINNDLINILKIKGAIDPKRIN